MKQIYQRLDNYARQFSILYLYISFFIYVDNSFLTNLSYETDTYVD